MFATLRRRLILSHMLPMLVILPILGIALVYFVETRVVLRSITSEVNSEGLALAALASDQPDTTWSDPAQAAAFMGDISWHGTSRVMLLDKQGVLLASSDPADAERLGQRLDGHDLSKPLAGQIDSRSDYSPRLRSSLVDVFVPVTGANRQVLGVVRLSYPLNYIQARLEEVRYIVLAVISIGLLVGLAVGWILAVNMARPLKQVTQAVDLLASGDELSPIPEQGPEEISRLVRAFNGLTVRLRLLEQSRQRLLGNLVHELGRPLGALYSATQALLGGAAENPELRQELLTGMEGELKHLERLLNDLARLYDQGLGRLELQCEPTAVGDWLTRDLAPWREAAQKSGLTWRTEIPPVLPTLEIDPDRLSQALGNLLSNAIKYTPPGGEVSVGAAVEDQSVQLWVSDTGPGIALEEQADIFARFYRGQKGRRFPQGMGLGLSIARDVVVAHGGRLEVESAPGRGSRFTIWLPRRREPSPSGALENGENPL
jgi:two-component system, OmpR family, sensor histidine kinase BaeS